MTHLLLTLTLLFPILLLALLLPFTAHSQSGIVFGIALPLETVNSPETRTLIAHFRRSIVALAIAAALLVCVLSAAHLMNAAIAAHLAGTILLLVWTLVLRARAAQRLRPLAIQPRLTRSADLAIPDATLPLLLTAAPLLLVTATAFWLRQRWAQIPTRWPRHWNAAGQVNGWGTRTPAGVYLPLLLALMVVLLLVVINGFNTKAPGPQARQRAQFAAPLAALSWLQALIFCMIALQPLYHFGITIVLLLIGTHMFAILAVVVWMLRRTGFLTNAPAATVAVPYDGTSESHWHAGIFYANSADPAVLVSKRFGFGWTLNFARPAAWVFAGIVLLLALGGVILPLLLRQSRP